jgi:deoxycytidine triphosphate deaminase
VILSDVGIRAALASGDLEIDPPPQDDQYTPSSIDLFLGGGFRVWDRGRLAMPGFSPTLDLALQNYQATASGYLIDAVLDAGGAFVLQPGQFVLAVTRERVNLRRSSRLAARVEGRSSMARLGLVVHLTAPTIHAGFSGNIALEMVNFGPFHLRLVPETTRVCQLIVEQLSEEPGQELRSGFVGQRDPGGRA